MGGVIGVAEVARTSYVDETQFDPKDPHYWPKAFREKPIWDCVDVKFVRKLSRLISLEELKTHPSLGKSMELFTKARLSVCRVSPEDFQKVLDLEAKAPK